MEKANVNVQQICKNPLSWDTIIHNMRENAINGKMVFIFKTDHHITV